MATSKLQRPWTPIRWSRRECENTWEWYWVSFYTRGFDCVGESGWECEDWRGDEYEDGVVVLWILIIEDVDGREGQRSTQWWKTVQSTSQHYSCGKGLKVQDDCTFRDGRSSAQTSFRIYTPSSSCSRLRISAQTAALTVTYDHRLKKMRHPVRSAISKLLIGRLVVEWVTISEYLLLYVFCPFWWGLERGVGTWRWRRNGRGCGYRERRLLGSLLFWPLKSVGIAGSGLKCLPRSWTWNKPSNWIYLWNCIASICTANCMSHVWKIQSISCVALTFAPMIQLEPVRCCQGQSQGKFPPQHQITIINLTLDAMIPNNKGLIENR